MNDVRDIMHLLHEGRAIAKRIIMSPNSRKYCIHHSDIGVERWHEASTVGEKRNQSRLTQKGALPTPKQDGFEHSPGVLGTSSYRCSHVRPRNNSEAFCATLELQAVRHKIATSLAGCKLYCRMSSFDNFQASSRQRHSAWSPLRERYKLLLVDPGS